MPTIQDIKVDLLSSLINLAETRQEYHDRYSLKSGSMKELMEYEKTENYQKVKEKKDALENSLNSQDFEDVKIMQVIMYIGRDTAQSNIKPASQLFEENYDYHEKSGWNKKSIEVSQMVQKVPLAEYLIKGKELLNL
ncbi:hypothetical protein [Planococcus sp. CAU13]|uniref:hypothetical protein n=1 Tax=Planococcus sp. CAU13 TaxID=1541197 RepID=UPI00052FF0FA|nr:hypothetical protein [Planococcus sp. CAU13]